QCAARCLQAHQVGGDYYDFLDHGQGKIGLVLADISGKGISAALLMSNLQANLRSHSIGGPADMDAALQSVNRIFHRSVEVGNFATLFFSFYDDATGVLSYVNCGHVPPILVRRNATIELLNPTATVVGVFDDWKCGVQHVTIGEGDLLLLY